MSKIIRKLFVLPALLMLSTTASAAGFSYNYGQVSYDDLDFDLGGVVNIGGDGFSFAGSFEITPEFFALAKYGMWDLDFGIDADALEFGGGYHRPLKPSTDLVLTFTLGNIDFDGGSDVDTWAFRGGVRHQLDDKLEIGGSAGFVNYDAPGDSETELELGVNALYSFKQNIAGFVAFTFSDPVDVLSLGARMYF